MVDRVNKKEQQLSDHATLALHLDQLMRRMHRDLHPKASEVDAPKVGPLGGMVLMTIEENEPVSVQAVARLVARDKGQITRFLQTLERKGLVVRTPSATDGRVSLLQLTAEGRTLVAGFRGAVTDVVGGLLVDVEPEARAQLLEIIKTMLRAP
ncbi:MAG: MarR family transcriptional regulator [Pseudomonadota bacterium]